MLLWIIHSDPTGVIVTFRLFGTPFNSLQNGMS